MAIFSSLRSGPRSLIGSTLAAVLCAGLFAQGAAAMPVGTATSCVQSAGLPDITGYVTPSTDCIVVLGTSGRNDSEESVNALDLFGFNTWVQDVKDDSLDTSGGLSGANLTDFTVTSAGDALQSGTWNLASNAYDSFSQLMLVIKDGNGEPDGFVAYLLQANAITGDYNSPFVNGVGDLTVKDISHISIYGVPSAVPIPAALPLFLSAMFGLGFMRNRRGRTTA